jgi:capsular polysaccharide transport system ATP-binding protein
MIVFEGVSKKYRTRDGRRTVFEGVDLALGRGEAIGSCGQNGAG